jgi:hypothetical protein
MAIGDIRPQDLSEQLKGHSSSDIKMSMNVKMSTMIKSERRAVIKGEMRMMGIKKKATQEQDHHIQGCATMFKEITA